MRFPVVSQKALKSGTEPGSVANTSKVAPFGSADRAFRVLRIGNGQARPFKSKVLSAMHGLRARPHLGPRGLRYPAKPATGNNDRQIARGACVPAAPTPRCSETRRFSVPAPGLGAEGAPQRVPCR